MLSRLKLKFNATSKKALMTGLGTVTLVMGGFNLATSAPLLDGQDKKKRTAIIQKRFDESAPIVSRPLTSGEIRLAKNLFGEALDISESRINLFQKSEGKFANSLEARKTKDLNFHGEDQHSDDYSTEESDHLFGAFVRKLTHLWQNQQEGIWQHSNVLNQTYSLNDNTTFQSYGRFQQASIMEDYARRFLDSQDHRAYWMEKTHGAANCKADSLLIDLVEQQFPAAARTRRQLDNTTTRPLTAAEDAFARVFFGDELSTTRLKIHLSPRRCREEAAIIYNSKDIYFWGSYHHADDYVLGASPVKFAYYAHEITHAVQGQANYERTNWQQPGGQTAYRYPPDVTKWSFDDYGIEQQAAMVEDYTRYFLSPEKQTHWLREQGIENHETLMHLRQLVENRFPGAQRLCKSFEKAGKAGMLALLEKTPPRASPPMLAFK